MIRVDLNVKFLALIRYTLSMFIFLNSSSIILFWVIMEVNIISLIFMIFSYSEEPHREKSLNAFSYLIVQTIGRVIFFIRMLSENRTPHYLRRILLSLSLITKIGIFPIQIWVFKIAPLLTPFILSILLSFQKIPLIILIVATNMETSLIIMISRVIIGRLMLIFRKSLIELSISSSIYFTFWAWMIAQYRILRFFLRYCIYFIVTIVLLKTQKSLTREGRNKSLRIRIVILRFFFNWVTTC